MTVEGWAVRACADRRNLPRRIERTGTGNERRAGNSPPPGTMATGLLPGRRTLTPWKDRFECGVMNRRTNGRFLFTGLARIDLPRNRRRDHGQKTVDSQSHAGNGLERGKAETAGIRFFCSGVPGGRPPIFVNRKSNLGGAARWTKTGGLFWKIFGFFGGRVVEVRSGSKSAGASECELSPLPGDSGALTYQTN